MAKQNFACPQKLCFLPMKSQCSERYHTPHAYLCQKIEHCPWGIYPLIHLLTSCKWHENCMSFRTMFWYILIYVLIYLPYPFFILPHLHVVKCYLPQGGDVDSQNQRQKTRVLPAFPYLETLTMRKMERLTAYANIWQKPSWIKYIFSLDLGYRGGSELENTGLSELLRKNNN